jgi:hypothetical protein
LLHALHSDFAHLAFFTRLTAANIVHATVLAQYLLKSNRGTSTHSFFVHFPSPQPQTTLSCTPPLNPALNPSAWQAPPPAPVEDPKAKKKK